MEIGDLVRWSEAWLADCRQNSERENYKDQIGIIIKDGQYPKCWHILWSDRDTTDVHYDYLEAVCG